jgi:hypothetical protein
MAIQLVRRLSMEMENQAQKKALTSMTATFRAQQLDKLVAERQINLICT